MHYVLIKVKHMEIEFVAVLSYSKTPHGTQEVYRDKNMSVKATLASNTNHI